MHAELGRRVELFKETKPFLLFHIENMKIIQLTRDEVNTTINNHILVFVYLGGVTTSGQWRLVETRYLRPRQRFEIKFPGIVKFIIIIIFATEYEQTVSINFVQFYNC